MGGEGFGGKVVRCQGLWNHLYGLENGAIVSRGVLDLGRQLVGVQLIWVSSVKGSI